MEKGQPAAELIRAAYDKLKGSSLSAGAESQESLPDAAGAAAVLEDALRLDFDNGEIKHALKCVVWWLEHTKRIEDFQNPFEKGGFILSLLKQYYVFLDHFDTVYDQCQYAVRRFVFSTALRYFEGLLGDGVNQHDPGLLLLVGRCYKGVGNYDEALKYLEQAVRFKREDAETLAELADINALLAETRAAKALFREAFFLDPGRIDLRSMESALILRLRDKVAELGYKGQELREWIPVYGCLWGVFSVKRELKQIEVGRLKQSIFNLDAERQANPERSAVLKPRLLNRYFWLIDHYESKRESPELIDETLLKIKVTDPDIYERYTR
jgi:tetratricopeptide (TPR) repeat protein